MTYTPIVCEPFFCKVLSYFYRQLKKEISMEKVQRITCAQTQSIPETPYSVRYKVLEVTASQNLHTWRYFSSRQAPHNTCVWRHRSHSQVYTTAWRRSAVDSIVLPTTQKFMINHLGFGYTMKQPFYVRPGPMLLS